MAIGRFQYYNTMKSLAHDTRLRYGIRTRDISLSLMRDIYRQEDIKIDYWKPKLKKVRGAYFPVDDTACVLINAAIKPKEPRIFTLAHELKHHLVDREQVQQSCYACQDVSWSDGAPIEIGAEVYAAELILPESEFLELASEGGLVRGKCTPEAVVYFKNSCPAPVSYTFIVKRLQWFGVIDKGDYAAVHFKTLEQRLLGAPFHR